jgi:hypothetical protein
MLDAVTLGSEPNVNFVSAADDVANCWPGFFISSMRGIVKRIQYRSYELLFAQDKIFCKYRAISSYYRQIRLMHVLFTF